MRRLISNACVCCCALAIVTATHGEETRSRLRVRRLSPGSAPIASTNSSSALTIVAGEPALGAIDARDASAGWDRFSLTFDADVSRLTVQDFTVTQVGGDGTAPGIAEVRHLGPQTVQLRLDGPMQPGSWLLIDSGENQARYGFLPGDVNADGVVNGLDVLKLVDALNGAANLPLYSTDIDRSGAFGQADVAHVRSILDNRTSAAQLDAKLKTETPDNGPLQGTDPELNVSFMPDYPLGGDCAPPNSDIEVYVILNQVNTGDDIAVRGMQFDTTDTAALLTPLGTPVVQNDIGFWDFSTQGLCDTLPSQCGIAHFIVDTLPPDDLLSVTYTETDPDEDLQLIIPGDGSDFIAGKFLVEAPLASGQYKLDVVNGDETDVNRGFYLVFGFGVEPGDPVRTCGADTGEVTGGSLQFTVCGDEPDCVIDVDCDDGVDCTVDTCDTGSGECSNTPDDDACDDDLFCTGVETCDVNDGCQSDGDPCGGSTPVCDEAGNQCVECLQNSDCAGGFECVGNECVPEGCTVDADCDDDDVCNGLETCDTGSGTCQSGTPLECDNGVFCDGAETCDPQDGCQDGTPPCDAEDICDEDNNRCVECLVDIDCDGPGETCDAEEGICEGGVECLVDDDCDNRICCDGEETCVDNECVDGTPVDCPGGQICTEPDCDCEDVGTKITLDADGLCYYWGELIEVEINMVSNDIIEGGQFFLAYDNQALDFFDIEPGDPWSNVLFEDINEPLGIIDYSVTTPFPPACQGETMGTMATIQFLVIQDFCGPTDIVWRGVTNPPTRLTTCGGEDILAECNDATFLIRDNFEPTCPPDIEINADAGVCSADLCFEEPSMSGPDCPLGGYDCIAVDTDGNPIDLTLNCGTFPVGVNTVTCVDQICARVSCQFTITVSPTNSLVSIVQLSPLVSFDAFDRCITWEIYPALCGEPLEVSATLTFGGQGEVPGHGTFEGKLPCGDYGCVRGRDALHTLRSIAQAEHIEVELDLPSYTIFQKAWLVEYKGDPKIGGNWLVGGNLNDDCVIDVLDFGVFIEQLDEVVGADSDCDTSAPHADINGDGVVDDIDYDFIADNFLTIGKQLCCPDEDPAAGCLLPPGNGGRIAASLIVDNKGRVLSVPAVSANLKRADLNGDGVLNLTDMDLFEAGVRPPPKVEVRIRSKGDRR